MLVGNSTGFATIILALSGIIRMRTCVVINIVEILDVQYMKSDLCKWFELENKTNIGFLKEKNIIRAVPTIAKKCINPIFRYFHTNKILVKRENN
jgi:hypothetical protein